MNVTVRIPVPLRKLTGQQDKVTVNSTSIKGVIDDLDAQYSGVKGRICDESGNVRRFINIYLNGEDTRYLNGLQTPVAEGDEVSIVPAVAGGF